MMHNPRPPPVSLSSPPLDSQLLSALPARDWHELRASLEDAELVTGATLYEAGTALRHVYFPTTAVVSLTSSMRSGASAEVAVVGREGIVGVCAYMGAGQSLSSAVVQGPGHAWRMPAAAIRQAAERSLPLMQALLGYTQALFAQMAQTSACSRHHMLEQQLCRWLLLHLDHGPGAVLAATQEHMAHMLGVRREGVTMAALKLQKDHIIRYGRGRVEVLDRAALEARSCECYAVIRGAYLRLSENVALARESQERLRQEEGLQAPAGGSLRLKDAREMSTNWR